MYIPQRYREPEYEKRLKYMLIGGLETEYIFDNSWAIKKFLNNNDFLIDFLYEVPIYIHQVFGYVSKHLKHVIDPEGDFEGLFITIRTHLSPTESLERLNEFDKWWITLDFSIRDILEVDTKIIS
jgi:hypothetical protein